MSTERDMLSSPQVTPKLGNRQTTLNKREAFKKRKSTTTNKLAMTFASSKSVGTVLEPDIME